METLLTDLRYVLRSIWRRPAFSALVVLTLGLGLGVNTAMFSVVNQALLRQPPYEDPEQLVILRGTVTDAQGESRPMPWSYPYLQDLEEYGQGRFDGMTGFAGWYFNLTGTDVPERLPVEIVSPDYFQVLGLEAAVGRVFYAPDGQAMEDPAVAVLGDGLWRRRFGADPGIVGRTIQLDGSPVTVVGVLPPGVHGITGAADAWVPVPLTVTLINPGRLEQRYANWLQVVARLAPGFDPERAAPEVASLLDRIHEANPRPADFDRLSAEPVLLRDDRVDPALRKAVWVLFAAVALVALIACVNVVGLLVVGVVRRQRETAIRVAMGIDRRRLVRHLLLESGVLGLLGGVVGLAVALIGVRVVALFRPVSAAPTPFDIARPEALQLDSIAMGVKVLGFNFLIALAVGLLVGVWPALRASRVDVNRWIKDETAGMAATFRSLRRFNPLSLLVVAEIALSLVLLVGGTLMVRNYQQLRNLDLGFQSSDLVTFKVSHPFKQLFSPERLAFHQSLLTELERLPGVEGVTATSQLPVSGPGETTSVRVRGLGTADATPPEAGVHFVGPGHFETMGIPLLDGRGFTDRDRRDAPRVAVISESAAREIFGGRRALGEGVRLGIGWGDDEFAEVVGVVGDVRYASAQELPVADIYVPFLQNPRPFLFVAARTSSSPETVIPAIRQRILELDPTLPMFDVEPMDSLIGEALSDLRFTMALLSIFAAIAFLLAAVGLYGVMAYSISGRTTEIGIRMALGARWKTVLGMLMREGLLLTGAGLVIGLVLALASTRVLSSFLHGLSATDLLTYWGVSAFLLLVSMLAIFLPARRATRVEPRTALQRK